MSGDAPQKPAKPETEPGAAPPANHRVSYRAPTTGVLFVHGIGQQAQGDTLIGFGQPLAEWIRRWVEGAGEGDPHRRGSARIRDCALGEPILEPGTPAHFELEIEAPAADPTRRPRPSRWVLAESWWATEFRNPPFGQLAAWLLGVGAWMILSHAGKLVRRLPSWRRWVLGPLAFAGALATAFLVQILVAAIAVLAVLPIPPLRNALSGLLLKLTGTLGDSYVLVSSPVQRAAAIAHLRKDLEWLSRQSDRVVVVAHSQGAAIAHEALAGRPRGKVRKLLTFGAGIGKLEELKLLMRPSARLFYLSAQFGLPLSTIALLLMPRVLPALFQFSWDFGSNVSVFAYLCAPIFLIGHVIVTNWRGWSDYSEHLDRKLPLSDVGIEWCDCHSSADPIPNGPLGGSPERFDWLQAKRVVNRSSAISDHSAYWANQDQFVPWVVEEIDRIAESGLVHDRDREALDLAATSRLQRVRYLFWARLATVGSLVAVLLGLRAHVIRLGEDYLWTPMIGLLDDGVVRQSLQALLLGLEKLITTATAIESTELSATGFALLAVLPLAALAALWYALTAWFWGRADQAALEPLFERSTDTSDSSLARQWLFMVVVSAGLPVLFAGASLSSHDPRRALDLLWTILRWGLNVGCWLYLLMMLLFAVWTVLWFAIFLFRSRRALREQGTSVWAVLGKSIKAGLTGLRRPRSKEGAGAPEPSRVAREFVEGGYTVKVENESWSDLRDVRIELDQASVEIDDLAAGGHACLYGFASRIPPEATATWRARGQDYRQVLPLTPWQSQQVTGGRLRFEFRSSREVQVSYEVDSGSRLEDGE